MPCVGGMRFRVSAVHERVTVCRNRGDVVSYCVDKYDGNCLGGGIYFMNVSTLYNFVLLLSM